MAIIQNGARGGGHRQRVDETNRAYVRSVSESEQNEQASLGLAYSVPSGFITLTNSSESAIFFLKNNEDQNLLITRFLVSARSSTGGSETHCRVSIYRNPTAMLNGTSVSLSPVNLNFGSSNVLSNTSEVGLQGASFSGGTLFGGFVVPLQALTSESASIVLPKGASIGLSCTPPTGNSSFIIGAGISCHLAPV